jgi:hypothetical protein
LANPPVRLLPTFRRQTASALTLDCAWPFGAGFVPLVALIPASRFGLLSVGGYLLSGAFCTLLAIGISRRLDYTDQHFLPPACR